MLQEKFTYESLVHAYSSYWKLRTSPHTPGNCRADLRAGEDNKMPLGDDTQKYVRPKLVWMQETRKERTIIWLGL